ncbi:histidine phosphatase family protein [uncultured Cocleimonas sp.]|uniref:histidine phosphatase family protein n=1 Tax=uncultured Cocleimonas sp. TaxID=1051587 RepID=UPI002633FE59|nr:histidine phosphatase family protein [uncultured Cocleimonas sp.]
MSYIKFSFLNLLIFFTFGFTAHAENKDGALIKAMQGGGHILMIRHAKAPGFGDPANIKIDDCSTQRNLDQQGRQQSEKIGEWLRSNNIEVAEIYSSQWCRCLDTARLLNMGVVKELPALNSFFQMPENREPSLRTLKQFISDQSTNQKLIIMVTHHVTIAAISGQNVASGDGVLLKLNASAPFEFVGIFSPE